MKALLRKDLPWIVAFLALGTGGMVTALCQSGFVRQFVVTPVHRDELFHVAWICGLVLGITAFGFDSALGTRDFLAQRPVSTAGLVRAQLLGCAVVLVGWFLLVPLLANVVIAVLDPAWEFGHWQQLPSIWTTMTPAVSATAIGAAATALPFAWWTRLLCLAPMFLIPFTVIFWLERSLPSLPTSDAWFAGGHLVAALLAIALLWAGTGNRRDVDRKVSLRIRRTAIAPMLLLAGLFAGILLIEIEANAVQRLRRVYPQMVEQDGKIVLATRSQWDSRDLATLSAAWTVVDGEHRATGERLAKPRGMYPGDGIRICHEFLRIEGPRHRQSQSAECADGLLWMDGSGIAWWAGHRASLRRLTKAADAPRFQPGTRVECLDHEGGRDIVLIEPDGGVVWRFDPANGRFRRLPLANEDRAVACDSWRSGDFERFEQPDGVRLAIGEEVIRGEKFAYALRDGELRGVGRIKGKPAWQPEAWRNCRVVDADVLAWTLEFPGGNGIEPFRHRYEPRTAAEKCFALLALSASAIRPPMLQVVAGLSPGATAGDGSYGSVHWLLDPMVAGGRRWWLVVVTLGFAAVCLWGVRRRLRHLGADASTLRFWTVATLLLGPVGAWACVACERQRAYVQRAVAAPVATPRITTAHPIQEPVA